MKELFNKSISKIMIENIIPAIITMVCGYIVFGKSGILGGLIGSILYETIKCGITKIYKRR